MSDRLTPPSTDTRTHDAHPELQYVKALFYRNEFQSCIAIGEELLRQLTMLDGNALHVHRAYINLFTALAHDDLARQMYDQSRFKISRFELAERQYLAAQRCLHAFQRRDTTPNARETPSRLPPRLPRERSSISLLAIPPTPSSICSDATEELSLWQRDCLRASISAMHERIDVLLSLLQDAKQRVILAQAKRAAARTTTQQPTADLSPSPLPTGKKLQASKSFWLFTPDVTKSTEKERRIEEGRKRGWARQRFQPARYRLLAEHALADL